MSKAKISVRQQQFGFPDEDLKTSLHDEIVLWLKKNSETLSKRILEWNGDWDNSLVEKKRASLTTSVEKCKAELRAEIGELANERPENAYYERERWTPKTRPLVKIDFRRSAGSERKQTYESKTETA